MQAMCSFGPVKGFETNGMECFLGIPYGKAERFQPPKPCDPWEEEKDCTHFGKFAIETDEKENEWQIHSEDCLNLNVFTPSCQGKYPVVVNLHGGAFQNGAADRTAPFSRDVVFVDVNYRLGVWGFLQMPGLPSSGNNGLLDQILALHWVKNEIAAFGGDPQRITVMGLSAGAKSVGALLAAPGARDTFSQAILSSGATQSIRSVRTAESVAREFFRFAGCEQDPNALLTMQATDLLKAQRAMCMGRNSTCLFGPVADGIVIPENWDDSLFSGHGWKGRLLIGSNRREMMEDGNPDPASMAEDLYGDNAVWAKKAVEEECAGRHLEKDQERLLWLDVHSDFMYRLHADRLAEKMSVFCPVWSYSFEFAPATHAYDHTVLFGDETNLEPLKQADFDKMHERLCGMYQSFLYGETPAGPDIPAWPLCRAPEFYKMRLNTVCQAQPCPQGDSRRNFPDCVLVREQEGRGKA